MGRIKTLKFLIFFQMLLLRCLTGFYPVDTGRKLNVHKTFRRRSGRFLNVSCTFKFTSCVYWVNKSLGRVWAFLAGAVTLLHEPNRTSNNDLLQSPETCVEPYEIFMIEVF